MGTIMTLNSISSNSIKSDIVDFTIRSTVNNMDAQQLINDILANRNLIKDEITSKKSYIEDSYKQNNISVKKKYLSENVYSNGETEISENEYNQLSYAIKKTYEIVKQVRKFCGYTSDIVINGTLNIAETTVNDFIALYDMCIKNEFNFTYSPEVSDEVASELLQKVYIECINDGIKQLNYIISNVDSMKDKTVNIIEILDPNAVNISSSPTLMRAANYDIERFGGGLPKNEEPVQLMLPELVEDLFKKEHEYEYNLTIKANIE